MLTPSQIAEMAAIKYPIHGGSLQEIICNLERKAYIAAFTDAMELMSKEWGGGVDMPPTHQNYVRVLCDDRHHILPHWFNNGKWYCYGSAGYTENVSHWQEFKDLLP